MSLDAAQVCLLKNPVYYLLSMKKSARQCVFCTVSKTPHFRVETYIELI